MWSLRKKLTAAFVLVALALAAPHAGGAAEACQQCPRVTVQCPERVVSGESATYVVSIEGFEGNVSPAYKWTTSAGTITSGQGTASITVDTTGLSDENVGAKVEVEGLPEGCPKTASCATNAGRVCGGLHKYDEYANISYADEKARLDNFAIVLQNEPGSTGYILAYGGRVGRAGEAQRRAERAMKYLSGKMRDTDAGRIVTVDGGYREELTVQLWAIPRGFSPPTPEPAVDPAEVKFVKESKTQGRRRP